MVAHQSPPRQTRQPLRATAELERLQQKLGNRNWRESIALITVAQVRSILPTIVPPNRSTTVPPDHETCYICAQPIDDDELSRDHVPQRNLFNPEDRDDNLITLPTHGACNEGFSIDDNWFQLMTAMAAGPVNEQARRLWDGPVMRGFHRDEAAGLRAGILQSVVEVEVESPAGVVLGTAHIMLQDAERV